MDTSETYIKMCDCPEIQGLWNKSDHDSVISYGEDRTLDDWRWLPRQDELQDIVSSVNPPTTIDTFMYCSFHQWSYSEVDMYDSWEQLWLAFVMRENFRKEWDGSEWVAITD